MTDKEKLEKFVAEIERLKKIVDDPILSDNDLIIGERNTYMRLLSFYDSMQEEPVSEILEVEIERIRKHHFINDDFDKAELDGRTISNIARHFAAWQKQQMMANAVDAVVKIDAGGYPYIPQMELYDYDKDIPLAKEGEKVKVIVIKED